MKCSLCHEFLDDFTRGKLDVEKSLMVTNHLESCAQCSFEYESLKAMLGAFDSVPDNILRDNLDDFLPGVWEKIDSKVRLNKRNWFARIAPAIAAAAVLFLFVVKFIPVADTYTGNFNTDSYVYTDDGYQSLVQSLFEDSDTTAVEIFEDELYSRLESYDGYGSILSLDDLTEQELDKFEEELNELYRNAG